MLFLVDVEKERVIQEAFEKRKPPPGGVFDDKGWDSVLEENDVNQLFKRLNTIPKGAVDVKEYEMGAGEFPVPPQILPTVDAEGDAAMSGTALSVTVKSDIMQKTEVAHTLQATFMYSLDEMTGYSKHAAATRQFYEKALERRSAREGIDTEGVAPVMARPDGPSRTGSGILAGTRKEDIRIDREAVARMDLDADMDMSGQDTIASPREQASARNVINVFGDPRRR
jgi:hypothetical protein